MLLKIITTTVLIFAFTALFAQIDDTYDTRKSGEHKVDSANMLLGEIYIIPFQDELFNCMFSKEIMRDNNVYFDEMRDIIKAALMKQLTQHLTDSLTALSYTKLPEATKRQNDFATANTMTYVYRELPDGKEDKDQATLKQKLKKKKKKKEKQEGTYIKDGQIVSERSTVEKFMDAEFKNNDLLFFLKDVHQTKYVITINQLDIELPPGATQLHLQHNKFERLIKAHYTIFDENGLAVHGGIGTVRFPNNQNNLRIITEEILAELAKGLSDTFYTAVKKHENKK